MSKTEILLLLRQKDFYDTGSGSEVPNMSKISIFKKNDIIIAVVLLLLAAAGLFVFRLIYSGEGKNVRVTIDGELFGEYPLGGSSNGLLDQGDAEDEDGLDAMAGGDGSLSHGSDLPEGGKDSSGLQGTSGSNNTEAYETQRIEIPGLIGKCYLVIEGGEAYMESADCPNQICVRHSPVSHKGEVIVCLPNRIIIEID